MGFAKIASIGVFDSASGTSLAPAATLNLAAGDVLALSVGWEGADTTISASDGGSNNFTVLTHIANSINGCVGYVLSASANGTATITVTFGAAMVWRRMQVLQLRPDSGDTITLDAGPANNTGSTTGVSSANINTSGISEAIVGFGQRYFSGATWSNHQVAGGAADEAFYVPDRVDLCSGWYKIFTSDPGDGINASATLSATGAWVAHCLAFKSVAAGGPQPPPGYEVLKSMIVNSAMRLGR